MADVVLEHLRKKFGDLEAVKDLTLKVEDGRFVCFLGPSGCGKTTTLRMIVGLEKQDRGDIYVGGKLVNDLNPSERDIAMVFQFYAMYPGATVRENLAFPLEQQKLPNEEIRRRVKETAEVLRIDSLLDKVATKLTSGEKQRVAIGRAIIRRPQVYLMDEPLSNLDAGLRAVMRVELKRLQHELKQTMIYVTHDQLEGMTMADKIAVMNEGSVLQYDTPETIYRRPKNLFVAGFVGTPTMNMIDCSLVRSDGDLSLDFAGFKIGLPPNVAKYLAENLSTSELTLGIRPQDIGISEVKTMYDSVEASVDVRELVGDRIIVDARVDGITLQVESDRRLSVEVGQKVWLSIDKERMHIFETKGGTLIV